MEGQRKRYTSEEKVAILKEHLAGRKPVSEVCERHGIAVNMFYRWRVAVDPASGAVDVAIPRAELPPPPESPPAACVTNIVPSAYDPGVMVTNIVCTNGVRLTDSGYFRLADLADTDGDGVSDGDEMAQGSAPLDPADHEPRDTQAVAFSYGDPSGSHSEKYRLTVTPVSGDPRPAQTRLNRDYGEVESVSLVLIKGAKYTVSLDHIGTDPAFMTEYGFSNYDWELDIGSSQGCLVLDDPDQIVTTYIDWPNETFLAAGKHATLALLKIQTQTVATQPADRTRTTIGVGEEVNLKLLPEGLGLITWNISSGSGYLSHYFSNGSILFTAPSEASDTTVTASVLGGGCEVEFEIIEPTAFIFENTSLVPPELHLPIPTENWLHIRYYADMYLSPDTVNFYNSRLFEGESDPYPVGYFTLYRHGMQKHNANGPHPMTSSIVPGKGTLCSSSDMVTGVVELNKGSIDGLLYWELLWEYDTPQGTRVPLKLIRQENHIAWVNGEQVFTVTKNGSGYFASTNQPLQAISQ